MHPHNKRERAIIGRFKGIKRTKGHFHWMSDKDETKQLIEKEIRLHRDTTKLCSCSMCGNPRKTLGNGNETFQEVKDKEFVESEIEDMEELTDWE